MPPDVPLLGRWLTFLAERAEHARQLRRCCAMTEALALHWATGQSALEDANLAALLGWIDPPAGLTGAEAARAGRGPVVWPPAGPATDPAFDNEVLAPAIRAYAARDPVQPASGGRSPRSSTRCAASSNPTWRLMWRAVDRLRALPAGASVADRWAGTARAFTGFREYVAGGGPPQGRRDGAVAAARRLNRLERATGRVRRRRGRSTTRS